MKLRPSGLAAAIQLASLFIERQQFQRAIGLLSGSLTYHSENPDLLAMFAASSFHALSPKDALVACEKAASVGVSSAHFKAMRILLLLEIGAEADAVEEYIDRPSRDGEVNRGSPATRLDRRVVAALNARANIPRLAGLEPRVLRLLFRLGQQLARRERYADALRAFTACLAADIQPSGVVHEYCAALAGVTNQPELAISHYKSLIELDAANDGSWYGLGLEFKYLGKTGEAISAFSKAVGINPFHTRARFNLLNLLIKNKDYDAAVIHCHELIRQNPESGQAWQGLGRVLDLLGRSSEAGDALVKAFKLEPRDSYTMQLLANWMIEAGDVHGAAKIFGLILDEKPTDSSAIVGLADALKQLGHIDGSRRLFERVAESGGTYSGQIDRVNQAYAELVLLWGYRQKRET